MKRRRPLPELCLLGLLISTTGSAPLPAEEVSAWQVRLPGQAVDRAVRCRERDCELLVLVRRGEERTAGILRLTTEQRRAVWLEPAPPADTEWIAVVGDGPGQEPQLLAAGPHRLSLLAESWQVLPGTGRRGLLPGEATPRPGESLVATVRPGELELWRVERNDVSSVGTVPLPLRTRRRTAGLELESPPAALLRRTPPTWVVGPELHGSLRVRTLLYGPMESEGSPAEPQELWGRLPGLEEIEGHAYHWIDGRLLLMVETVRADKVTFFGKRKVRIFQLTEDRTRAGIDPLFEVTTSSRLWQRLGMHLLDADGDGLEDVVLIQPEGFDGDRLLVDVHPGRNAKAGLAFEPRHRRSVLRTPAARWHYGEDLDGDELADLVVLSRGRIELHLGTADPAQPILEEPLWTYGLPRGDSEPDDRRRRRRAPDEATEGETVEPEPASWHRPWGRPEVRDIDGRDGPEILFERRGEEESLLLILFPGT